MSGPERAPPERPLKEAPARRLAERLARLPVLAAPALPDLELVATAAGRVLSRWPDVVAEPPETERERLVTALRQRVESDDWAETPLSLVLAAAHALYDRTRRERPELAEVRAFYADEIRVSTRETFLDGMLAVHLASYQPGAPHTRALAGALSAARDRLGPRGRALVAGLPACLDPLLAPAAVAERMQAMDDPWTGLKALGLRSPHAPGLMDHAHLALVERLRPELSSRERVDWLLRWLKPEGVAHPRDSGAAEALAAILAPWQGRDPDGEMKGWLTQSLVGLYGDPRVERGGVWAGVAEAERAPLLRWLAGENIRFFLDVVTAVEDSHMWEPRREFWLGLYEQGLIDGAWVAFSKQAERHAERIARDRGARGSLGYGIQTANRANTSLLLLQIGRKIVVEGSHDYKVHIFDAGLEKAPKLYQPAYNCEVIRLVPGSQARAHLSGWQFWVQSYL